MKLNDPQTGPEAVKKQAAASGANLTRLREFFGRIFLSLV
jgi:hypothetical protein